MEEKIITKDLLGQAIAETFEVAYAEISARQPSREQVLKIPESLAKKYHLLLYLESEKEVVVATDNPKAEGLLAKVKPIFPGKKVELAYGLPEEIEAGFIHYRKPLATRFVEIIKNHQRIAPEIIGEIIEDALAFNASDIHFEPQEKEVVIRFRIDGVLREAGRIPKEYYENILNRIKVEAHLRIDEHYAAQDGAIRYVKDEHTADLRVSIVPTLTGEKVAIRMLAEYVKSYNIYDLGLSYEDQRILEEASKKPFGMILVTGPTGSGKSTTLYAVLRSLNRPEVNITTIEDPVEYRVEGLNQIQVNPHTNLTFAEGLRSIVRQDPDIVLVGEIRDLETAEIAVNAALTGHLLLSTFHSNDAATAIPRLLDMGIEPFLLASTLEVIIAQRLVRKLCENCRYSQEVTITDLLKILPSAKKYFSGNKITLYKSKGCKSCNETGYRGRTAIFEFIKITKEMEELILNNPSGEQIWHLAKKQNAHSLFEDGLEKVKRGITTVEELLRVAQPSED